MADPAQLAALKASIDNLLGLPAARALLQLNSNTCERAFEAYIFSLCCEGVVRAGGSVELRGILSGAAPPHVIFRGAPGSMASTGQNFAYARCVLKQRVFEIHVDVEYQGTSGALHEIDVSICDGAHADAVRASGGTPRTSGRKLIAAFECKFYETTPGVSLGRTFVGLISDCSGLRIKGFVSNSGSDKLQQFLSKSDRPDPFLGTNPALPDREELFIRAVEHALRKWN